MATKKPTKPAAKPTVGVVTRDPADVLDVIRCSKCGKDTLHVYESQNNPDEYVYECPCGNAFSGDA